MRIRLGNQWRGLPWDAVDRVVVQPRRGLFRDGRLMFAPHSLSRALDGLDVRGRRAAALNQKVYGAALAVPMGITTRVSAHGTDLADGIAALAQGRADVVVVQPEPDRRRRPETAAAPPRPRPPARTARRRPPHARPGCCPGSRPGATGPRRAGAGEERAGSGRAGGPGADGRRAEPVPG